MLSTIPDEPVRAAFGDRIIAANELLTMFIHPSFQSFVDRPVSEPVPPASLKVDWIDFGEPIIALFFLENDRPRARENLLCSSQSNPRCRPDWHVVRLTFQDAFPVSRGGDLLHLRIQNSILLPLRGRKATHRWDRDCPTTFLRKRSQPRKPALVVSFLLFATPNPT